MRIQVPFGGSIRLVDATTSRKGVLLMNVDATSKVFVSEDQRNLDQIDSTGNPLAGLILPVSMTTPIVIPIMVGALYARSGSPGPANFEVIEFDTHIYEIADPNQERRPFPYVNAVIGGGKWRR